MYFRDIVEDKQKKGLRKGYTTGACAAAAGKAAAIAFLTGEKVKEVQVTLPLGQTVTLLVHRCKIEKDSAAVSLIKDAGDDPDVTNGAEIVAEVATSAISNFKRAFQFTINSSQFTVYGGEGVGSVTKKGLAISILGTTGIVEPVSLSAYRDSITCAIDVAMASGCKEVVFSTGRSSEKVAEKELKLAEEAFVLVGDHMGFALKE